MLQTTASSGNPLSLSEIKTEFVTGVNSGVTAPNNLREYLRGSGLFADKVPNHSNNNGIAQSGTLNQLGFLGSGYNFISTGGSNWQKGFLESGTQRYYGAFDSGVGSALGLGSGVGTIGSYNRVQVGKWNQYASGESASVITIRGIWDNYRFFNSQWFFYYSYIAYDITYGSEYSLTSASYGYDTGTNLVPLMYFINGGLGPYPDGQPPVNNPGAENISPTVPLAELLGTEYSSGSFRIAHSNGFPISSWSGSTNGGTLYSGLNFISLADNANFGLAIYDTYANGL